MPARRLVRQAIFPRSTCSLDIPVYGLSLPPERKRADHSRQNRAPVLAQRVLPVRRYHLRPPRNLCPKRRRMQGRESEICRPRNKNFTKKPSDLQNCWSTRSSSITSPKWLRGNRIAICTKFFVRTSRRVGPRTTSDTAAPL